MAVIVIHAGMPKAGSSSVKRWLEVESAALRERGVTVAVARREASGGIVFAPAEEGEVNSSWVVHRAAGEAGAEREMVAALHEGLAAAAERHGDIVVMGESLGWLFSTPHEPSFASLQRLSARHTVRIAYYVRPQHTSLEALWRQNGFRSGMATWSATSPRISSRPSRERRPSG